MSRTPHKFEDYVTLRRFCVAGDAILTLRSLKTDTRFTYRFQKKKESRVIPGTRLPIWVKVLTGPTHYSFVGTVWEERNGELLYVPSSKSKIKDPNAPSVRALCWLLKLLAVPTMANAETLFEQAEVYHEGKCGRCGRALTVPESILTGIGPECAVILGVSRVVLPETTFPQREPQFKAPAGVAPSLPPSSDTPETPRTPLRDAPNAPPGRPARKPPLRRTGTPGHRPEDIITPEVISLLDHLKKRGQL